MKTLLLFILIALFNYSNAQTIDNFKIEHNPSKLTGKLHIVNTPGCKMDSLLYTFSFTNSSVPNAIIELNSLAGGYSFGTIDSIIPNKHGINDTVMSLIFNVNPLYIMYPPRSVIFNNGVKTELILPTITFTDFLKSNHYNPCYASVGPNKNIPTVYWESIENNMIESFLIKRNGVTIDTVQYTTGTLSYTDSTNLDASSYIQTYTIEAIDSSNNHRSGSVTTLHARNLASVDGNIEMDWTIPTTSAPINNFIIYEYKVIDSLHDTLIVVHTLPSNITQYSVVNPNINSSYVVGIENLNCTGTSLKSLQSNLLLSNKLRVKGYTQTNSIEIISIDKNDVVIGYYDLLGRNIESNTKNQIIIKLYKSGRSEKIINE